MPLLGTFRRLEQAEDALDRAREAEEFQAVGLRCRECLLTLVHELASDAMVPEGAEPPKLSDFIHWSEHIANWYMRGSSLARPRSYLKALAREAWEVVNWVTHARSAHKVLAEFAVRVTGQTVSGYAFAHVQPHDAEPERCPNCSSYRLFKDFRPDDNPRLPFWTLCEVCGWERGPESE